MRGPGCTTTGLREHPLRAPTHHGLLLAGVALAVAPGLVSAVEVVIGSSSDLTAALAAAGRGDVVRLLPGEYVLDRTLQVPDGVTLNGGGTGATAGRGETDGFAGRDAATIRAADTWYGDLVHLGDGTELRRIRIVQAPPSEGRSQFGNGVVVASRRQRDRVVAAIRDCDVYSNATIGGTHEGPTGRAVAVLTRSPEGEPTHRASRIELTIERTSIRAPRGNALFVNSFAPETAMHIEIRHSVLVGSIAVSGGTSRREVVSGSTTRIRSAHTQYRSDADGYDRIGWLLIGASGSPFGLADRSLPGGVGNRTIVESYRDRIDGFKTGVQATGFRRVADHSAPGSDNILELRMRGTSIRSNGEGAADIVLRGAAADAAPGQRNLVRAKLVDVEGSGPRANRYLDCDCGPDSSETNHGNRVVIEGSPRAFVRANPTLTPPPPDTAFREPAR